MSRTVADAKIFELIRSLWNLSESEPLARLLPNDSDSLRDFYPRLREFVDAAPRLNRGRIDSAALVRGEIVSMGEESVIEAGAVIHESCRLILGARSRVRSGAVLRDEVVVGPECTIGAHCEVVRSLILGPSTVIGHFCFVGDSILGSGVNLSAYAALTNTTVESGRSVLLKWAGARIDTGRSHLGALIGDRVRFGSSIVTCPGCVILPGLSLPPAVILYGTIDERKRKVLIRRFYDEWDLDAPASE